MKVGSVVKTGNSYFLLEKRNQWRQLRASGIAPGSFTDDDLNDVGESELLCVVDGDVDVRALFQSLQASRLPHTTARTPDYANMTRAEYEKNWAIHPDSNALHEQWKASLENTRIAATAYVNALGGDKLRKKHPRIDEIELAEWAEKNAAMAAKRKAIAEYRGFAEAAQQSYILHTKLQVYAAHRYWIYAAAIKGKYPKNAQAEYDDLPDTLSFDWHPVGHKEEEVYFGRYTGRIWELQSGWHWRVTGRRVGIEGSSIVGVKTKAQAKKDCEQALLRRIAFGEQKAW